MSENDATDPFDEQSDAESLSDSEQSTPRNQQSRRVFLRNVVVASAATAGVVGTAATMHAAGLIHTPAAIRPLITRHLQPSRTQLSPLDPSSLCIEETALPGVGASCFGGGTNTSGQFWLFFTIRAVAVGNYTAELTQSANGGVTQSDFTTSSTPFKFTNSQSVHVAVGGSPVQCPTAVAGDASSSVDPIAVQVTGSTQDVQIAIHIVWNTTGANTYTFNATLKDSSNNLIAAPASVSVVTPCP